MRKLSSFALAALLFVSTLLFVTPNAIAQTAAPITYGQNYYIQNGYNNWGGGYLDTNNVGCEGNLLCVSTASSSNRAAGSGTWGILSASGKQNGTPVQFNDNIYLQNLYPFRANILGGYLDTNSAGCEKNLLCVSTASSSNRAGGSGTWKILSASGKQNDTPVLANDEIYFQNQYGFRADVIGGYLDTNGGGCEKNLYCVSTAGAKERGPLTTHWRLISTKPETTATKPTPIDNSGTISTEPGKTYKVQVTVDIPSDIGYDNSFGIFAINDDGSVAGVKPGDPNYAATVVKNRVLSAEVDQGSYKKGQTFKYDLPGGRKYGVFLIANGTPDKFLESNSENKGSNPPLIYFFDTAANPDQKSHVKVSPPNQYGFEDTYGGGDQDFDDLTVKLETVSVETTPTK